MSKLSPHFDLSEFIFSQTAVRHGIKNDPSPEIIARLVKVAHGLERVRSICGDRPIRVSSGYRSMELNRAINGASKTSAHTEGWAVDFTVRGMAVMDVIREILDSGMEFDQVINEGPGQWVHLSFKPNMRRDVLTATFRNGKATYTKGL